MPADSPTDTVLQVAALARLELDPTEAAAFGPQLAAILAQFQTLAGVDVEGVEPMTSAAAGENVLRADEPVPSLAPDAALSNAPARVDDFYRVPKTVGGLE
ncbi:MAG: Asp-tRNA(Asn)/Glu-tRNA(Gln) amidotransferase subunit GatC [Planctomycetes bacterium]|nr:Asp-tRNA(Asn)/Glu-tRNA(Gln) amidotransferase subunit GatC [Planctomycetota bacterium]